MSKIHKIIQTTYFKANEIADECIRLYNDERVISRVYLELTLGDLNIRRLTGTTKTTVLSILRRKGFERVRYDYVTQTFRGNLSFPDIVFEPSNLAMKPIALKTPVLRTMMGDVYRLESKHTT